jgi:regulator of nonsense transcripts 1
MILSPYKKAVNRFQGAANRPPLRGLKRRVQVTTIDAAQGQEADVVFLDMARSRANSHNGNPKRLASLLLARDGPKSL